MALGPGYSPELDGDLLIIPLKSFLSVIVVLLIVTSITAVYRARLRSYFYNKNYTAMGYLPLGGTHHRGYNVVPAEVDGGAA